ncbi:hypothetical protein PVAG01_08386 [Phlyctema vagabunda]|uniref:Rhodopsin domain-containing protein n=1 Tax=Phlyctema vagabunda TaxID=108571 RepID=A0ABR4P9N1_9HELO
MLDLKVESWIWFGFATLVLIARYTSRWMQLGSIMKFQADDFVMIFVFCFYTVLIVTMNIVAHVDTNLMLPEDVPLLTPETIRDRIYGSKMVLVVEQSMITVTWGCKVCLLCMYYKLTFGLKQVIAVKALVAYVGLSWLVMEILYFGVWCKPFHNYWAVPTPNAQCSAAVHHLITNAVFNISSDIMMLMVPLPLLISSKLPRVNKIILCGLFSMGVFVILCAALNKYYSFASPFSPMWTYWYIREASTAVLVANMPMCWALVRRVFRVRSFIYASKTHSNTGAITMTAGTKAGSKPRTKKQKSMVQSVIDKLEERSETSTSRGERDWWEREGRVGSTEDLVTPPGKAKVMPLEIWESKQFNVVDNHRASGTATGDSRLMYNGLSDSGKEYKTETVVTARHSESSDGAGRR